MPTPPRSDSSGWLPSRGWTAAALLASLLGCAGDAPWDVRDEDRVRFRRADRECRLLTQDTSGAEGPISFDQCMNRRGFERMGAIERLWKS